VAGSAVASRKVSSNGSSNAATRSTEALYRLPRTTRRHPAHPVFPYLLRGALRSSGPIKCGYLAAVMDWFSRRVLAWRVSISMGTAFCVEALEEAIRKHGAPQIMDGRGCWRDNVFVERLWRTVK
jgi:putative transposase